MVFRKRLVVTPERKRLVMELDEKELISDTGLLMKSGAVLAVTTLGLIFHGFFHYEPATVALAGAALLLLVTGFDPREILAEVEWDTIAFFVGLFIIVGAVVKSGVIESLSRDLVALTHPGPGDTFTLAMVMIWFSAAASAVVDNIPFVATMNPLLMEMIHKVHDPAMGPALLHSARDPAFMPGWWALSLGSCLGGNATAIGASANVIVVGMAEKAGYPISFLRFMKYGIPVTLLSVIVAMIYIIVRYYAA
jgi:Na+/H+ antiporter NhaD/arsenite permease-like protein